MFVLKGYELDIIFDHQINVITFFLGQQLVVSEARFSCPSFLKGLLI